MITRLPYPFLLFIFSLPMLWVNAQSITVPIGGNAWVLPTSQGGMEVKNSGIANWTHSNEGFTTYFRISHPGTLRLWAQSKKVEGQPELSIRVLGQERMAVLDKPDSNGYYLGDWTVKDTGYIPVIIKGIQKKGCCFPEIQALVVAGTAVKEGVNYVKNNEGHFFHWGRRGPSVHLAYPLPKGIDVAWFYNEVTVPKGEDIVGSYFMANGFSEGYFGMQVNSLTERRILFSVWSPFETDDPKKIPADQKIVLLKKGPGVYTGEFGNEGSGGQSYLKYNWQAGTTYRFLLQGIPDGPNHTRYTAYFFDGLAQKWLLIASFRRPMKATYLKGTHSFLENFSPNQGDKERKVFFGNQWIQDTRGQWHELTQARLTADNTAHKGYRMDYGGGVNGHQFYLRNCGFFNDYNPFNILLNRKPENRKPMISFSDLP